MLAASSWVDFIWKSSVFPCGRVRERHKIVIDVSGFFCDGELGCNLSSSFFIVLLGDCCILLKGQHVLEHILESEEECFSA